MGTATAAKLLFVISNGLVPPTVSTMPNMIEQPMRASHRANIPAPSVLYTPALTSSASLNVDNFQFNDVVRQTSEVEKAIGEIRNYGSFSQNWDGEGANLPSIQSIKDSVSFLRLIADSEQLPQPMLHATGNVSLFWNDDELYADVEFLGQNRVAYFIKRKEDKHKGVISFDSEKMPAVFSALIKV